MALYDAPVHQPMSAELRDRQVVAALLVMLEHGGEAVEAGGEHACAWLASATVVDGRGAEMRRGTACMCHGNSMELAARDHSLVHHYGYALAADGCWYEHSWCVRPDGGIVETTLPRLAYLGVPVADLPSGIAAFIEGAEWMTLEQTREFDLAEAETTASLPPVDRRRLRELLSRRCHVAPSTARGSGIAHAA